MESRHSPPKRVSGHFPQCGAIFMADNLTRKECFQRKIFGLPYNFANFVMKIKTGMVLFLFDHQNRKLYGVFKATSDGAINIVPHAYRSSRKQFPAQVRFDIVWRCVPVPEEAFRDAIGENYFSPYKFNFGLSRDQVKKLLVLFEMRRIETGVSRNLSSKRKWQIVCGETNSEVKSKRDSDDSSESLSKTPPGLAISDDGNTTNLDGYKPLPSVDQTIENTLPDGLAGDDFIPLPAIDVEETKDPLPNGLVEGPFKLFASQLEYDALQSAIDSLFSEVEGCPLQEDPEPQDDDRREGDEQIGDGCHYQQVNGLYSDSAKERTSVFLRLSGLSKVIKQGRSHHHDKIDSSRESLGGFEKIQKPWKKVSTPLHDPKASKNRQSVFSRLSYNVCETPEKEQNARMSGLSYNVRQTPEKEQNARVSATENECMPNPEGVPEKKRKNHIMETLRECEGSISMKEEHSETNKRIRTSENSWETKISDHFSTRVSSTGLVLLSGISASTANCESCGAACKSDEGRSEVASEESKFCEPTDPHRSCPDRATKMMMEFQPSASASSGVELPEGAFVRMHATEIDPNSSADGSHESDLEFLSVNVDGSTTVSDLEFLS